MEKPRGKIIVEISSSVFGFARRREIHTLITPETIQDNPEAEERAEMAKSLGQIRNTPHGSLEGTSLTPYWVGVEGFDPGSKAMLPDNLRRLWGTHNVTAQATGEISESGFPVAVQVTAHRKRYFDKVYPNPEGSKIFRGDEARLHDSRRGKGWEKFRKEKIRIRFQGQR